MSTQIIKRPCLSERNWNIHDDPFETCRACTESDTDIVTCGYVGYWRCDECYMLWDTEVEANECCMKEN